MAKKKPIELSQAKYDKAMEYRANFETKLQELLTLAPYAGIRANVQVTYDDITVAPIAVDDEMAHKKQLRETGGYVA